MNPPSSGPAAPASLSMGQLADDTAVVAAPRLAPGGVDVPSKESHADDSHEGFTTAPIILLDPPIANIVEAFAPIGVRKLYHYLHNENEPYAWVMAFKNEQRKSVYVRSKKLSASDGISRAIDSIRGRIDPKWKVAYVPYAKNALGQSRWAGMDFDAHDGNRERPRALALAALEYLHREYPNLFYILERTATAGWHLWIIDKLFRAVAAWVELLGGVAAAIGTSVSPGICEIFPNEPTGKGPFGHGLQAPGAVHPRAGAPGEIFFHNINDLVAGLRLTTLPTTGSFPKIEKCSFHEEKEKPLSTGNIVFNPSEKGERELSAVSVGEDANPSGEEKKLALEYEKGWATRYPIDKPHIRNEMVKQLVSQLAFQVSKATGRRIAAHQFELKTVDVRATLDEHLADFDSLWSTYINTVWTPQLPEADAEAYRTVSGDTDQSAFRIFYGYHILAQQSREPDFRIVRNNLARRLAMTGQGAGKLITRFMRDGIIARTQEYIPEVRAAYYCWTAGAAIESSIPKEAALPTSCQAYVQPPVPERPSTSARDCAEAESTCAFAAQIAAAAENALRPSVQSTEPAANATRISPQSEGMGAIAYAMYLRESPPGRSVGADAQPPGTPQILSPAVAPKNVTTNASLDREIRLENQILAQLGVKDRLPASELRSLVNGSSENPAIYEGVLKALELRLIIDKGENDQLQLGPTRKNRKLFMAMNCLLDLLKNGHRYKDGPALQYEMSAMFGIDSVTLGNAMNRLEEAGLLIRNDQNSFWLSKLKPWEMSQE